MAFSSDDILQEISIWKCDITFQIEITNISWYLYYPESVLIYSGIFSRWINAGIFFHFEHRTRICCCFFEKFFSYVQQRIVSGIRFFYFCKNVLQWGDPWTFKWLDLCINNHLIYKFAYIFSTMHLQKSFTFLVPKTHRNKCLFFPYFIWSIRNLMQFKDWYDVKTAPVVNHYN